MSVGGFPMEDALAVIRERISDIPEVFVVLGSGLSGLAHGADDQVAISYREIPGFPDPGVKGHDGRLVCGRMEGKTVLFQAGRFHFYEGHDPAVIVAPLRIAAQLGASSVILTNAAGGIAPSLGPGDILLLEDHVNLMFRSPLSGARKKGEERFPDLSSPYDPRLQALAVRSAEELGIRLARGTYAAVLGPSYETPAEIRFLRWAGADAVGMSTVPEAIVARALGLSVLGFSLVTNLAAGLGAGQLDHGEVLQTGRSAGEGLGRLIRSVLARM